MTRAVVPVLGSEQKVLSTDKEIIEYLVVFTTAAPARSLTGGIWNSSMISLEEILASYDANSVEMALNEYGNKLEALISDHIPNSPYIVSLSHEIDGVDITIKLSILNEQTGENILSFNKGYPL